MSLSAGSRLGPYDIVSPLGAGGMGEVYRATDARLKRQVAVKILPPALAADSARLVRFQREAEVLASLNHPHIAAIYGLEDSNGVTALIMELVEGPTLADRIAQGPIPVDEALAIARQIAEALEAAHEQGIIHRDLKPANIKVRDDGQVKVLDFGLAKARERADVLSDIGQTVDTAQSPTIASPAVSQAGVILGTAAYMSPEQARGKPVDKRTDVWAFGAVLYEMLTGARAFEGEDVTELLASVVKSTPNWAALPADLPSSVVTLIQRCLEKDRKTRIGDIAVARFLLSADASVASAAPAVSGSSGAPSRWLQLVPWVAAAVVVGAMVLWLLPRRADEARPVAHLLMNLLPAESLASSPNAYPRPARTAMVFAPDGRRVVFAGARGTATQLYARALDQTDAMPIPGTEGGQAPMLSPDGAWIGFWADDKMKKVPVGGGPPVTICDLPDDSFWGASWGEDDTIFFAARAGMFKVAAAGGTPSAITTVETTKGERHLLPQPLPGGRALLFTAPPNVALLSLDTGERRTILEGAADARYVDTGHLVYMKSGTLMAVPFDVRSMQATGSPVALIENVMHAVNAGNAANETLAGQFAVSRSGALLYVDGGIFPSLQSTLVWADRNGVAQPLAGAQVRPYLFPRLSPDGQKVAVAVRRDTSRETDVWMFDVARQSPTKLTFDGGGSPVWSPDSRRVLYASGSGGITHLELVNGDGSGTPERLATGEINRSPASWASGPRAIVFLQRPTPNTFGIWVLPMDGGTAGAPRLFLESRFSLQYPELSPDGRWMAYVSLESGSAELYVQAYPGGGEKIRISTEGGLEPIWTNNGRELLYRSFTPSGGLRFMSVTIRSSSPFQADAPRVLFESGQGEYDTTSPLREWDVTRDGQRFLLTRISEFKDTPVTTMHVVLNWAEELKRRVPTR